MQGIEKVIKGLCEAIGILHAYIPKRYWGYGEQACRDAIALLKEQQETIEKLGNSLNDQIKQMGWEDINE